MRGLNIATALKQLNPETEILFYARGALPEGFNDLDVQFFLDRDEDPSSWTKLARSFKPHVVVYDTMLPKSSDELDAASNAEFVYVMRKCSDKRQNELLQHWAMERMRITIVPHDQTDFAVALPSKVAKKTHFVGAIVRLPDPSKTPELAAKYDLSNESFNILSTPGGGGFTEEARLFFDVVAKTHEQLIQRMSNVRHVVVKGPKYEGAISCLEQMCVVDSEPDLVHLLPQMDLVISAGGYNTVTEIRMAKAPAVFLPSPRTHDDQLERVSKMQAVGLARVCVGEDSKKTAEEISKLCTNPQEIGQIRDAYDRDSLAIGNELAARLILELGS